MRFGGNCTEFGGGFFLIFGRNYDVPPQNFEWILFEIWRELPPQNYGADFFLRCGGYCLHRIFGRILFEIRRELPPRTTGPVPIHNNFLANFLKRLELSSPIFASFARDNIICTKTGINVKQSYLLTYSPRVNFISPAMFYFCTFLLHTLSRAKLLKIC